MSFGKAKRFNRLESSTPAVGQYDLTAQQKANHNVVFEKVQRFQESKEGLAPGCYQSDLTFQHPSLCSSFRALSHSTPNLTLSAKKLRPKKDNYKENMNTSVMAKPIKNLMGDFIGDCQCDEVRHNHGDHKLQAITENMDSPQQCSPQDYKDKLEDTNKSLSQSLTDLRVSNLDNEDTIRHLKGELFAYKDTVDCDRQTVFEASAETALLSERIEELEETEETLNTNIKALTDKYIALEQQYVSLSDVHEEKMRLLQAELNLTKVNLTKLRSDHSALQKTNVTLHDEIAETHAEKEQMLVKLATAVLQSDAATREIHEKVTVIEELIVERDELLKVDCELREVVEELRVQGEKLRECVAEKDVVVGELVRAEEGSKERFAAQQRVIDEMCVEKETLREALSENECLLGGMNEEKVRLLRSLEGLRVRMEEVQVEREDLVKTVSERVGELAELNGEVERMKVSVDEKQVICDGLLSESEGIRQSLSEKVDTIQNVTKEKMDLELRLEEQDEMLKELREDKDVLVKSSEEKNTVIHDLSRKNEEFLEKMAHIEELKTENNRLVKLVQEKDDMISDMAREINEGLNKQAEWTRLEAEYRLQIEDMSADLLEQECCIQRLEEDLRKQKSLLKERDEHLLKANKELVGKEGHISEMEEERAKLQEKFRSLEKEFLKTVEGDMIKIEEVSREKDYMSKQLTQMGQDVEDKNEEMEQLKTKQQRACEKLEMLEVERLAERADLEEKNVEMERHVQESNEQMHELSVKVESAVGELRALTGDLVQTRSEKKACVLRINGLEQEVRGLEGKREEMRNCNEKLGNLLNDKEEEMEGIQEKSEELTSSLQTVASNHATLHLDFDSYKLLTEKTEADLRIELERLRLDNHGTHSQLQTSDAQVTQLQSENTALSLRIEKHEKDSKEMSAQVDEIKSEKSREDKKMRAQVVDLVTRNKATQMTLCFTQEKFVASHADSEKWRAKHDDLYRMIEPFREQLSMFEAEKNSLLNKSKDAQKEISKLGREYANILGHQNNKQKIKHIVNLKDENSALREEVSQIRGELDKRRRQTRHLEEKVAAFEGRRRLDTSQAFSQSKENLSYVSGNESKLSAMSQSTSRLHPLRDGNRV